MATKKTPARPKPLGTLVDELWAERERKRAAEAHVKTIDDVIESLTSELMERMENEGLDAVKGQKSSISVGAAITASVQDWDAFSAWIIKNRATHLLQRRVSDPAYRELLEAGKKVPGVEPFIKKKLNIRSL